MGSLETSLSQQQQNEEQPDAQWVEAIDKIAQLTREGTIKWSAVEASAVKALRQIVISAYQDEFEGKTMLLQETMPEARAVTGLGIATDSVAASINAMIGQASSNQKTFSLRIVDDNKSPLFVFPNVPNVVELMAAIKYQLADIDSFLGSLRAYGTTGRVGSGSK